jgi:hypothetical protein
MTIDAALRLARALVDAVRLLPDEERDAVLQGARLRRDALALARVQGATPGPDAVRAMVERFRRARGLRSADALDVWLEARASHREDFGRWIRDEAALQTVGLSAAHLAPRDIVDFARVAEGADALWARARAAAAAEVSARAEAEVVDAFFSASGRTPPADLESWAQRAGFEGRAEAVAAMARQVAAALPEAPVALERVRVGDPAPAFALHHFDAGVVRCADFAGQPLVLVFAPDEAAARALRARWDVASPAALLVAAVPGEDGARVPWLIDAEGEVIGRFGLEGARAWHVVLDAAQRVRWIGEDPATAEASAASLAQTTQATSALAPVLLVPEVFDADECAALVARWSEGGHGAGAVTANTAQGVGTYADGDIKRRADHVVTDPAMDRWIRARLARRVAPELLRAFHFVLGDTEAFRGGCSDAADGGVFRAHRRNCPALAPTAP